MIPGLQSGSCGDFGGHRGYELGISNQNWMKNICKYQPGRNSAGGIVHEPP